MAEPTKPISAPSAPLFNPYAPPTRGGAAVGPNLLPGSAADPSSPHQFVRNEHFPEECMVCGRDDRAGVHQ